MALDINEALFNTGYNYQKVALSGTGTSTIANDPLNYASVTIPHDLGYIPSVRVWYNPDNGKRFALSEEQYTDDTTFTSEVNSISARAYLTSSNLVLQFRNSSGSSKDVSYWYRIYYDA